MHHKTSFILFFLSAVFAYGQVTLAISEVKEQRVNQRFSLTILLEISGENMEQETPLRMPDTSKFDIIGSASERNTIVLDSRRGAAINQLVYQYVLSPKQAGKIKFGSVLVTVNGKIYKTEPFDIIVRDSEKTAAVESTERNDLYLNLELEKREVYQNEPTVAILRAYSRNYNNFRKLGPIHLASQKNAKIAAVSTKKSEIESEGGVGSQVIGVYTITPTAAGTVDIAPFSAQLEYRDDTSTLASNATKLHVKKLPTGMPQHYKNAVGHFSAELTSDHQQKAAEVDQPIHVTLKISGTGNLNNFDLPALQKSPQYIFYAPKITSHTKAGRNGTTGSLIADYIIIPKQPGQITVEFENFSFFDPARRSYTDLGASSLQLEVQTPAQIADAKSTIEKVNEYTNNVLETVNTPVLQTQHLKIKDKERINWKVVFGNLAFLSSAVLLFLFVRRQNERRKLRPQVQRANSDAPIVTIAETEQLLRTQLVNHFDDTIDYLSKLKDTSDFSQFFTVYDELHNHALKNYQVVNESEFRRKLEREKGASFSEQYRNLAERIQIEKFSPVHTGADMDELFELIKKTYSDIAK